MELVKPYEKKDNEFIAWYPCSVNKEDATGVWQKRRAAYYVHIPFCTAICDYCGFAVQRSKGADIPRYLDALQSEIRRYADSGRLANYRFDCGHFGGGTPSVLSGEQLMNIQELITSVFDISADAEITVEVNPISFTPDKAQHYRESGVNRISFGVQTFNDRLLKIIGRPHRARDVEETLDAIHGAGFNNFSLDVIYGIPSQSLDELLYDLQQAVATGAVHMSCFRLEIIPFTALHLRAATGDVGEPLQPELLIEMENLIRNYLTAEGFREYGVFNFVRPGFESVHNDIAFRAPQDDYIGFGNGSYSYINGHVYCNYADIPDYETAVARGEDPIALAKRVDYYEAMSRYFVLGLKFLHVSRSAFISIFGLEPERLFGDTLARLEGAGLLEVVEDGWDLTLTGRHYVNNVCKEFYVGDSVDTRQFAQFVPNLTADQILRHIDKLEPARP